jgi:hypothetical protein
MTVISSIITMKDFKKSVFLKILEQKIKNGSWEYSYQLILIK